MVFLRTFRSEGMGGNCCFVVVVGEMSPVVVVQDLSPELVFPRMRLLGVSEASGRLTPESVDTAEQASRSLGVSGWFSGTSGGRTISVPNCSP